VSVVLAYESHPLITIVRAIESKTHGNVLWAPLDHGATRIGYAYSAEIAAKYPDGVTQEVAESEAIEAMKPFKVKFKEIHWWTLYTIGQRIAETFATQNRIFLCGDAAHTHSSGAAQGLNTGIHDAVNLGWKLALQIRGVTQPGVLETYSPERMSAVQKLLDYDRDISILMSHKWPSWYKGDKTADPYLLLGEIFEGAASFNTGLGISYKPNVINQAARVELAILPGSRPPDVELTASGTNAKVRFQRVTRNMAKFWVVVWTGDLEATRPALLGFETFLSSAGELTANKAIGWLTICPTVGCSPYEALGMKPFGDTYFDPSSAAHDKLGINSDQGSVIILRPDGLVACSGPIEGNWIKEYFAKIMR
jgi:phenol 2-monooxygenase